MNTATTHYQAGVNWQQQQQLDLARQAYEDCLAADPAFYEAHHRLGLLCQQQQQWAAAEAHFKNALSLNPHFSMSYYHLGLLYQMQGHFERANQMYQHCVQINPGLWQAYYQLGVLAEQQQQLGEAFQAYQVCLSLNPALLEVYHHLGRLAVHHKQIRLAVSYYIQLLKLQPQRHELWDTLFQTLQWQPDIDLVMDCIKGLILHYPERTGLLLAKLAHYLEKQGEYEAALDVYEQALQYEFPERPLWELKKDLTIPLLPASQDELTQAVAKLEQHLTRHLARADLESIAPVADLAGLHTYLALFYAFSYVVYYGVNVYTLRRDCGRLFQRLVPATQQPLTAAVHVKSSRPTVGMLVSSGVPTAFCLGLLNQLDPERFAIQMWYTDQSAVVKFSPEQIQNPSLRYDVLSADLSCALAQIQAAQPNILYFTEPCYSPMQNFLASFRLAPCQFTSWLSLGTSGQPFMDYYISSELLETPQADAYYTEQLVRFKTIPAYFYRPELTGEPMSRADFGLPETGTMYACPQSALKFHLDFDPWIQAILEQDPTGFLVMVVTEQQKHLGELILRRFCQTIPHVMPRIWVLPGLKENLFLHLLALADVMLDTPHMAGGLTSSQGFAMGTPIVTLPGAFMHTRLTTGYYQQMGINGAVAQDAADYISLAVRLGTDLDYRAQLKAEIQANSHRLFEDVEAVKELTAFFETCGQRHE